MEVQWSRQGSGEAEQTNPVVFQAVKKYLLRVFKENNPQSNPPGSPDKMGWRGVFLEL